MAEENTDAKASDEQKSESALPAIGRQKSGLSITPMKTFIGNRPIAPNDSEGEDALMGYLD